MGLTDCPECRAEVSEHARACPQCAYPIGGHVPSPLRSTTAGRGVVSALDVTKQIVSRLALGGMFFASGIAFEAPPVIVGALIVAGSSIPIWFKARRAERLGAAGGDFRQIEARVEQQLREAEDRTLQQSSEIEENARQIADLEERLDFTERLLTQHREKA